VTFGTGEDGDLVIDGGTATIESRYPKYDPRRGVYPQYNSVRLINGATLTTANRYNMHTNIGGLMMFTVKTKLEICSTCRIDVSETGFPGTADIFTNADLNYFQNSNARNRPGFGPGGGIRCLINGVMSCLNVYFNFIGHFLHLHMVFFHAYMYVLIICVLPHDRLLYRPSVSLCYL
jgi:hypothetical protein